MISNPKLTGWITFLAILSLTTFLTLVEYKLNLSEEREIVNTELNKFESRFTTALSDGISAAKTLGFFAQNKDEVIQNFEEIGRQILESNPQVDVIEFLDSGTIVAVYPLVGNEAVLGYNVLKDPKNFREVEESIRRKDVYFSGPITLRQGGTGIVGRYPLFDEGKFIGLSAVIIHFDKLVERALQDIHNEDRFIVQLSKVNPNTGILEKFVSSGDSLNFSGYKATVPIEVGNWLLSVQLKESLAWYDLRWFILGRIILSGIFGIAAWNFARQPSLLIKKLNDKSKEILLANERFELATRATSDAIWDWNLETNEKYRSSQFSVLFGYSQKVLDDNKQFRTDLIHPEDLERVQSKLQETLSGDTTSWEIEFRGKKADQTYAYVSEKGYIIRNEQGKAIRMIGATQNITKQKLDELSLIEANQKLSNANAELKAFASMASHDMREPLRMISSFMSLLEKKYGASLDDKAHQYISFAIDGAKRLTLLIHDLLDYSKVGFDSNLIESINTKDLIQEVMALKSALIQENNATLIIEELPNIKGVKMPLRILFQNLIGNALKYRKPDTKPEIKISGKEENGFWKFSIKDNGIGIEADYLEAIFGILKRLHPKEKYPGTGMGLAVCRKIILQHEGKIWAESTPGIGSEFFFTIKKHE
ncbi:hypothetical protein B0E43_08575 [Algoriphagus sp. A40]|nr:hypothetical protein B0E43_08575 [Algoriphagus sp. A40]